MLHAAQRAGARVVYAGSSSAYGDQDVQYKHEAMREDPLSPYAAAKLAGEEGIEAVHRAHTLLLRGTAYLRQAEAQNCIVRHNRDCCILPLRGGGVHSVPEPAVQARASFEQYLKLRPNDGRAIWLLNILAMAVGDYPQAVPARYLVPPKAFASEYDVGRFWDIAPALSVDTFNLCGGVIADDFDGDGLIDIVTSTYDPGGALTCAETRRSVGRPGRSKYRAGTVGN